MDGWASHIESDFPESKHVREHATEAGIQPDEQNLHEPFEPSESEHIPCSFESRIVELQNRGAATPIECISTQEFMYFSQLKRKLADDMGKLATFQDSDAEATLCHEFVRGLAAKGPGLLGRRQWPCGDGGPEQEGSVWLHIECRAAGTDIHNDDAVDMQRNIQRHLQQANSFNGGRRLAGQLFSGKNCRNNQGNGLDNTCTLQIALLADDWKVVNGKVHGIIGAAVLSIYGPAFGYMPFFAVQESLRGKGWGTAFARAQLAVLRFLGVKTLVVEAIVDFDTDQVVRFWEDKVGFARCSHEAMDSQQPHTNASCASRICGMTVRQMNGTYNEITCLMFRGTEVDWKLASKLGYPEVPALGGLDVSGGWSAVPHFDGGMWQLDSLQITSTVDTGCVEVTACAWSGESGELSVSSACTVNSAVNVEETTCDESSSLEPQGTAGQVLSQDSLFYF